MDQSPEAVRNVTLRVSFVNGTSGTVFEGVDWYWFTTGVTRGVRQGAVSFQENWRTLKVQPVADTLEMIEGGAVPHVFVFRLVFLHLAEAEAGAGAGAGDGAGAGAGDGAAHVSVRVPAPSPFDAAVSMVRRFPLAAPYYVVAAGVSAGVIIARSPAAVDSELWLPSPPPSPAASAPWFVVQTNYDQCKIVAGGGNVTDCDPL